LHGRPGGRVKERRTRRRCGGRGGGAADDETGLGAEAVRRNGLTERRRAGFRERRNERGAGTADARSFSFCPGKDKLDSGDSLARNERGEDAIHAVFL